MRLGHVEPGFGATHVHGLQLFRGGEPVGWPQFAEQVRERLLALPGVRAVTATTAAPLSTIGSAAEDVRSKAAPDAAPVRAGIRRVGPDYLALLDIPLLSGRPIGVEDRAGGQRVAVVNRELARRTLGDAPTLDQHIRPAVERVVAVAERRRPQPHRGSVR